MGSIRRTKVIELAKKYADEGYHEEGNNWTIFGKMLDEVGYFAPQEKNGQAWCMIFVDALFFMASDSRLPELMSSWTNSSTDFR